MGSANRFIRLVLIPLLVLGYGAFLVIDFMRFQDASPEPIYRAKLAAIDELNGQAGGLILGGSNAYYGLSARTLSERDGYLWYNFTMLSEGYSQASYQHAIEDAFASEAARMGVKRIVYSSINLLHRSTIARYRENTDDEFLTGAAQPSLELKPSLPLYKFRQAAARNADDDDPERRLYVVSDKFGDVDFEKSRCKTRNGPSAAHLEDADLALDFYDSTANFLGRLFPHAEIFMIVPSEFLTEPAAYQAWAEQLKARWAARGARAYKLVVQPPIPGSELLCTMSHHPNALGRIWRTADLIAQMDD